MHEYSPNTTEHTHIYKYIYCTHTNTHYTHLECESRCVEFQTKVFQLQLCFFVLGTLFQQLRHRSIRQKRIEY
jgi:hypothetical protein